MNKHLSLLLLIFVLFAATTVEAHKGISFQAVIKKPDGTYPTASGLTVTLQILDPVSNCVLREEEHSGINVSNGYLNVVIGASTASTPAGKNPSPVLSIPQVMNNSQVRSGLSCVDISNNVVATGQTYTPTNEHSRKLRLRLSIQGEDVVADFNMRAIAFAVNSEMLGSKTADEFINTNSTNGVTQANLESIFQRFTKLDAILNNSDSSATNLGVNVTGTAANVTGTVAIANGGTGATTAAAARTALGLGDLAVLSKNNDTSMYLRGDGTWASVSSGVVTETDPTVQTYAKNTPGTGLAVSSNQLTVSYGTAAGTAAQGNDSRITGAFQSSTTLGGDLSGTLPNPTVAKIKGQSVSVAGTSAGQVLRYEGSDVWTPAFVSMTDLRSKITGTTALTGTGCTAGQTLSWSSVTDALACISISITKSQVSDFPTLATSATTDTTNASNITSGTLDAARLPSSVTDGLWTASSSNVYRSSGSVGVGTTSPGSSLDVRFSSGGSGINSEGWQGGASGKFISTTGDHFMVRAGGTSFGGNAAPLLIAADPVAASTWKFARGVADYTGTATELWNINGTGGAYFAGSVGIGTNAPTAALQVQKTSLASPAIVVGGGYAGGPNIQTYSLQVDPLGWMGLGTDMSGGPYENSVYFPVGATTNGKLTFGTYDGTSYSEKMRVTASGYVGIGTTTPSYPLSVAGVIQSSSGGIMFPDGTLQTSAAVSAGTNNTMVTGWPDMIKCQITAPTGASPAVRFFPAAYMPYTSDGRYYYRIAEQSTYWGIAFNSDGSFYTTQFNVSGSSTAMTTDCDNMSISQLTAAGKTYNFAKGPAAQFLQNGTSAYYNAGKVGIGTSSPSYNLHVSGADSSTEIRVVNTTSTATRYPGVSVLNYLGSASSGYPSLNLINNRGSSGSVTQLQSGDSIGAISGQVPTDTAGSMANSAQILMYASAAHSTTSTPSAISFKTTSQSATTMSTRMTIADTGYVGIGTTSPSYNLHVVGTAGLSSGTAWTNASDVRLKDIHGDYEYGLNEVLQLHTVRYSYKKDNPLSLPSDFAKTGFIAQEVQKVIPEAVNVRKDGYLELNVDPIHWAVVNAIKDLYKKYVHPLVTNDQKQDRMIASLEDRAEKVEKENTELRKKNADLEARLSRIEKSLSAK